MFTLPNNIDNSPTVTPTTAINFGGVVTLDCTHTLEGTFQRRQTCLFDTVSGTYKFIGDNPECGGI